MDIASTTPSLGMDVELDTDNKPELDAPITDDVPADTSKETTDQEYEKKLKKAWNELDPEKDMDRFFNDGTETTEPPEEPQVEEPKDNEPEPSTNEIRISNPVLKFKGKDVPISSADELIALAQKGLKLEIEMQKIKPQKRIVSLIESSGIDEADIKALADAKGGNPNAIEFLATKFDIKLSREHDNNDIFDEPVREPEVDTNQYKPQLEPDDPVKAFWNDYTQQNPTGASKVLEIYNELDDTFKQEIYEPQAFPGFVEAVEMGEFEKFYPLSVKIKAMNPAATWRQAYSQAVMSQQDGSQVQQKQNEPDPATRVPRNASKERKPVREADVRKKIWNDKDYEEELMSKLFD
jgi:hypothetical protein